MFTYRRLDISYNLVEPRAILPRIKDTNGFLHGEIAKDLINKKFVAWLWQMDVCPIWAEFFYRGQPGADGYIHTDHTVLDHRAKVNQIFFDEVSSLNWHLPKPGITFKPGTTSTIGTGEMKFDEDQVTFLDRVTGTGIFVVNAGIPHSVTMRGWRRLCVSILLGDKKTRAPISCQDLEDRINSLIP
jgi:hypothetical protein